MLEIFKTHEEAIRAACRKFGVRRLEAFGSVLRPDFGRGSDVDLLVEFDHGGSQDAFEQYFGFKEAVELLVEREVDLVVAESVRNPAFRGELERTKAAVYVAA